MLWLRKKGRLSRGCQLRSSNHQSYSTVVRHRENWEFCGDKNSPGSWIRGVMESWRDNSKSLWFVAATVEEKMSLKTRFQVRIPANHSSESNSPHNWGPTIEASLKETLEIVPSPSCYERGWKVGISWDVCLGHPAMIMWVNSGSQYWVLSSEQLHLSNILKKNLLGPRDHSELTQLSTKFH